VKLRAVKRRRPGNESPAKACGRSAFGAAGQFPVGAALQGSPG
jgi:hypothetical protein